MYISPPWGSLILASDMAETAAHLEMEMAQGFPRLFSPIEVGKYTLKNRIVNTGHGAHFQEAGGLPTERYVDYVRERAKGGVGMIVIGLAVVYDDGEVPLGLANYDDRVIPRYRQMAEATHEFGVPLLAQLARKLHQTGTGD